MMGRSVASEREQPVQGVLLDVAPAYLVGVLRYAMVADETFNERVKRLRERTGLSQMAFADKAGLSREGYQKIERGVSRTPDNDSVRAIAAAAGGRILSISERRTGLRQRFRLAAQGHRLVSSALLLANIGFLA
jgi:transcriptional regulator with XRE-family HTH domain